MATDAQGQPTAFFVSTTSLAGGLAAFASCPGLGSAISIARE
jgi:hypothetical protein